jgi:hypothetical protein
LGELADLGYCSLHVGEDFRGKESTNEYDPTTVEVGDVLRGVLSGENGPEGAIVTPPRPEECQGRKNAEEMITYVRSQ